MHVETVNSEMARMYDEYAKVKTASSSASASQSKGRDQTVASSSSPSTSTSASVPADDFYLTIEEFNLRRMNEAGSNRGKQKTELDKYLAEQVDPYIENFVVLLWWKVNSARFPTLTAMVKDVLAVPISTVASESAFSTGGRILCDFRSSLSHESVQALVCGQDWFYPRGTLEEPDEAFQVEELKKKIDDGDSQLHSMMIN